MVLNTIDLAASMVEEDEAHHKIWIVHFDALGNSIIADGPRYGHSSTMHKFRVRQEVYQSPHPCIFHEERVCFWKLVEGVRCVFCP